MNKKIMKNIDLSAKLKLEDQVLYQPGQIVSKTLIQNDKVSITLFAFDQDEEISAHSSDGDALVTVLDGTGKFTIDGIEHILNREETIVMPATVPHAVYGIEKFKMMLVVVF